MSARNPFGHEAVEISGDEGEEEARGGQPESSNKVPPWQDSKRPLLGTVLGFDYRHGDPRDLGDFADPAPAKRRKFGREKYVDLSRQPLEFASVMLPADLDQWQDEGIAPAPLCDQGSFLGDTKQRKGKSTEFEAWPEAATCISENLEMFLGTESRQSVDIPPYYYDAKLESQMFRGPGYEKFPIVLGTIPEHSVFCEKWDREQSRKSKLRLPLRTSFAEVNPYFDDDDEITMIDFGEDESDRDVKPEDATGLELACLERILEVLPDVSHEFALGKVRGYAQSFKFEKDEEIQVQASPADIVAEILDLPHYPKEQNLNDVAAAELEEVGVTIQWQKGDIHNKDYQRDAVCLLANQFDYVPTHFIHKTVQEKRSVYESYRHIQKLEFGYQNMNPHDRPYRRHHEARRAIEKKYASKDAGSRDQEKWGQLVNEVQAAKQRTKLEEVWATRQRMHELEEAANLEQHKASGDVVECRCCFDDETPLNRAVSCEGVEMHWFCFACVLRLAENQVGMMKHQMKCMDGSDCDASLSLAGVEQAVPHKLCDKLATYKQQSEIMAAGIEGLEQCAFCDFKAICDSIDEDSTFRCQNPECRRVSCRKCHENDHLPKSCEEAKKDKGLSARHQVEEARSEAMMRTCPNCKVKIIKESGCNKMRCSKCGGVMCYVCKADISLLRDGGYEHFNKRGAGCKLYDKDHGRHDREADEAEMEAIKKARAENADLDERQLQVETGADRQKRAKAPGPRRAPLRPLPHNPFDERLFGLAEDFGLMGGGQMMPYGRPLDAMDEQPRARVLLDQGRPRPYTRRIVPLPGYGLRGGGGDEMPPPAQSAFPLLEHQNNAGAFLRPDPDEFFDVAADQARYPLPDNLDQSITRPAQMVPRHTGLGLGMAGLADWAQFPRMIPMVPMLPMGEHIMGQEPRHLANMAVPSTVTPHTPGAYNSVDPGMNMAANIHVDRPTAGATWFHQIGQERQMWNER